MRPPGQRCPASPALRARTPRALARPGPIGSVRSRRLELARPKPNRSALDLRLQLRPARVELLDRAVRLTQRGDALLQGLRVRGHLRVGGGRVRALERLLGLED